MITATPGIPWNTSALWQEANAGFEHVLHRHSRAMDRPKRLAGQVQARLAAIFPVMDRLCRATCPSCTDNCCQRARVWMDFRDLLFLHLAAVPVPDGQLLAGPGQRCRYAAAGGCRLERIQRPFVCTWYLCPAQTQCLGDSQQERQRTMDGLQRVKQLRRQMESTFITVLS